MTISAVSGWSSSNEALNTDLNDIPLGEGITRVPHFNGAIREMMKQIATFNTAPAFTGATASFTYVDSGASQGPAITFDRNSGSPAASDALAFLLFSGRDSGAAAQNYAGIRASITDPTAASEDGVLELYTVTAGTFGAAATLGGGLYMAGATDPGAGKVAATGINLTTGAVINWASSDVLLTHSANTLAWTGATSYTYDAAVTIAATTTTPLVVRYSDDGAAQGPFLTLDRNSASPAASDALGFLLFSGRDSAANTQNYAGIRTSILDATSTSEDGVLEFLTTAAGALGVAANIAGGLYMAGATDPGAGKIAATGINLTSGAVINFNAGDVTVTHAADALTISPTATAFYNFHSAGVTFADDSGVQTFGSTVHAAINLDGSILGTKSGSNALALSRTTNIGAVAAFYDDTTLGGTIDVNGATAAYTSVSDERIKENFHDFDSGVILDSITMYGFNFLAAYGGNEGLGVKARAPENQMVPHFISQGNGLEPGEEGFRPWAADYSKLVPVLWREVQQLRSRVKELEEA
jgi:hypothetical protein